LTAVLTTTTLESVTAPAQRLLIAIASVCVLAAVTAIVVAIHMVHSSRVDARVAESRALAGMSLALSRDRPEAALLLAVEALRVVRNSSASDTYDARNALVVSWQRVDQVAAILRGHRRPVQTVAFNPDGAELASGGMDGTVRIWSPKRHLQLAILRGHKGAVDALAWSPDGAMLASGGGDHAIRLWDVKRRAPVGVLRGHTGALTLLAFAPDGRRLASAGSIYGDGTVRVWNVAHRRQVGAALHITPVALRFGAAGRRLDILNVVGLLTHHSGRSPLPYREPPWDTGATEYGPAAFTQTGRWLVVSGEAGLGIWRVSGTHTQPVELPDGLQGIAALAAGKARIALGYEGGVVRVLDPDPALGFEPLSLRLYGGMPRAFAISPTDDAVAVGYDDGTVRIGRLDRAPLSRQLSHVEAIDAHVLRIRTLDGSRVAEVVRGEDVDTPSTVTVRDARGETLGKPLRTRRGLAVFYPDAHRIALVGGDGRLRLWSVEQGRPASRPFDRGFPPADADVLGVSADGRTLAAGTNEGIVLWDPARWAPVGAPIDLNATPVTLHFDGTRDGFVYQTATGYALYENGREEHTEVTSRLVEPILTSSDFERWRDRVCTFVARNLTLAEWRLYVPARAYRRTCQ
jgi:WD40 repeat protein